MLRLLSVIFFAFFIAGGANSAETFFDHNGSRISWMSDGQKRLAKYFEPRAGLENAGIKPGTILFEGTRQGNILSGTAYGFKYGCPPAPYRVLATIASEREFVLRGEAPVFEAGSSCVIARFDAANRNANLTFTFLGPEPEQGSQPTSELSRVDQPQRGVESNAASTPAPSTNPNNSVSAFTPEQLAKAKEASDNTLAIVSNGIELHVADIRYLLKLQLPSLISSKPDEAGYYSSRETSPARDRFFLVSSGTKSVKFDASFYLTQEKEYSTSDSARKCDDTGGHFSKSNIRSSIGWSSCTETDSSGWIYHKAYIRIAPLTELNANVRYRGDTLKKEVAETFWVNTLSALDRTTKELRERAVAAAISSKEKEAADQAARNAAAKAENEAMFDEARRAIKAAEVKRSQELQSSEIAPNSATFNIQSSYQYKLQIQFFSKSRNVVWPGAERAYNLDDSTMKKFRLSCQGTEQICFGGWTTGTSSVTWGVGPNGDKGCKGCCTVCGGSPLSSTLTYTGGGGQQESPSISAADLLGAAIAIGGGVAAAKNGGGGGSINIPSPSGYSQRGAFDDCAAVNAAAGNAAAAAECRRRATNMGSAPSR